VVVFSSFPDGLDLLRDGAADLVVGWSARELGERAVESLWRLHKGQDADELTRQGVPRLALHLAVPDRSELGPPERYVPLARCEEILGAVE
jgi:hypothetical protein